jgi:hypothetical protein
VNGTEQQARHTAVTRVERQLTDVQTVAEALDQKVAEVAKTTLAAINDERTHRLKLAEEQRAYVDGEDRVLSRRITSLVHELDDQRGWTFVQRWRWLFTGRP